MDKALRKEGYSIIAGVDEAGRGPLAGPVFAAAVVLPLDADLPRRLDSKKFSPKKRTTLYSEIKRQAIAWHVSSVDNNGVDRLNILQASLAAMAEALKNLKIPLDLVIVDGRFPPTTIWPVRCVKSGDLLSQSVGAASILAKVDRDRVMEAYHRIYPQYGFDRHKGYPTRFHRLAIAEHGPCPIHRKTYRGVKEFLVS
ncbi:MAG TPA: ribonuclease HII [Proteobacteria bacterium]|nr:ribonuclease HII [bacterium BMS3Abin14]HDL53914.1 ribonuclease HII [Pseudomonadota bacterium]